MSKNENTEMRSTRLVNEVWGGALRDWVLIAALSVFPLQLIDADDANEQRNLGPHETAYERLKGLEWMVGEWGLELPEGSPFEVTMTTRWLHKKAFLRTTTIVKAGDKIIGETELTWFWDPLEKGIRIFGVESEGECGRSTVEVSEGFIRVQRLAFWADSDEPFSEVRKYTKTGIDSLSYDDGEVVKYRRKK